MLILYSKKSLINSSTSYRIFTYLKRLKSSELEKVYSDEQKTKILEVINNSEASSLTRYDISKSRLKTFSQWKAKNGQIKTIADVETIQGFTEKTTKKLFDSIIDNSNNSVLLRKLRGQVLYPVLSDSVRESCKSVLAIYITVYSVCWTLIDRAGYEVLEWKYFGIDYPEGKKLHIADIYNIASEVTKNLPPADVYVMKGEATTLRAAGSDPNNPKVLGVNLQKAQMIAMIVALLNFGQSENMTNDEENKVYFLRPTLPFRLYGTLVGGERVSTTQTVEQLLIDTQTQDRGDRVNRGDKGDREAPLRVRVGPRLRGYFSGQEEMRRDMLGQCLLLALTFMDVCVYRDLDSVSKLLSTSKS